MVDLVVRDNEVNLLEKKLAEQPIIVPGSPFVKAFKSFGTDEAIAAVLNIGATVAASALGFSPLEISVAGPVFEKIGFFPQHFKEAWDIYKTTPENKREPFSHYFKKALRKGGKSLALDIAIHDPIYIGMMIGGQHLYPSTPAWLIAGLSFGAAVFVAAGVDVGINELRYLAHKANLKRHGFEKESYLESRFLVSKEIDPQEALKTMVGEFGLGEIKTNSYFDTYFNHRLPEYSGRIPKLRLRNRTREDGSWSKTVQITYTRTSEIKNSQFKQFNFYPQAKDKFYFILDQDIPDDLKEIDDEKVRKHLMKISKGDNKKEVHFERSFAFERDSLFVSADNVIHPRPFYVMEIKVYEDKRLLQEAMRYIMLEFPVIQTTHGKFDILSVAQ